MTYREWTIALCDALHARSLEVIDVQTMCPTGRVQLWGLGHFGWGIDVQNVSVDPSIVSVDVYRHGESTRRITFRDNVEPIDAANMILNAGLAR